MREQVVKLSLITIIMSLVSCSPLSNTSSTTTGSGTPAPAPTYSLYINLQGLWEGSTTQSFTDSSCYVPTGTATGGPTINCTVQVPEITLHFSDINFTVGTNSTALCAQVVFRPYYFQRSNSATYKPAGASAAADCSGATIPVPTVCYSGAAKSMVTNFPTVTSLYFLPGIATTSSYTLSSSDSLSLGGTIPDDQPVGTTNTNVGNGLAAGSRGVGITYGVAGGQVDYLANSMQDYTAQCIDSYGTTLYSLDLQIVDVDPQSPGTPDGGATYWDWNAY